MIERDRWGYEAAIRYEDGSGRPMCNAYGWCRGRTGYDRFGNWSWRAFYDRDGKPMEVERLGYHRYDLTWDRSGLRLLSLRYSDVARRPARHAERGYSRVVFDWDGRGNRVAVRYLDEEGRPVARTDTGVAVVEADYDQRDRRVAERCLDAAGRAVDDSRRGWATASYAYDREGFRLPPTYRDADGEETAQ